MEAVIKLRQDELDQNLLFKIKQFIAGREDMEVTISIREKPLDYLKNLDESIRQLEDDDDTITFTMEEFLAYPEKK